MNSVRMFVQDAVGDKFLFTLAGNTPENIASFRRHAAWWKRVGHKSSRPCFPLTVVVEPYQDETS